MNHFLPQIIVLSASALLVSCATEQSRIIEVTDLPLKDISPASMSWQVSPIRAHAQYVLYGAQSEKERRTRIGDYYFVDWYDADPTRPVKLEMVYTQAITASKLLTRTMEFTEPRQSAGSRKSNFFFNGEDRAKSGDIMTWRINLYVDGKLADSRHSYLWREPEQ